MNMGKDKNSNVYQQSVNPNHALVTLDYLTILHSGYKYKKYKRKIAEALFIKGNRPIRRRQDTSVSLKLFNWYLNIFEVQWIFLYFFFFFTFDINFSKSNSISRSVYPAVNTVEFGQEYFKYINIIHIRILSCAKSRMFWFQFFCFLYYFYESLFITCSESIIVVLFIVILRKFDFEHVSFA